MKKQKQPVEMLTIKEYAEREGITQSAAYMRGQPNRASRLRRLNGDWGVGYEDRKTRIYSDAIWSPLKRGPAIGSHWKWAKKPKKAKKSKK